MVGKRLISFTTGQKVRILHSLNKNIYEIVSWDDSRNHGRIEDSKGQGKYVYGTQIEVVEDVDDGWNDMEEDEDDFEPDYEY